MLLRAWMKVLGSLGQGEDHAVRAPGLGDRPAGHRLVVARLVGDDFLSQGPGGGVHRPHLVVAVRRSRQVLDDVEDLPVGRERVVFERPGELDDPGLDSEVRARMAKRVVAASAAGASSTRTIVWPSSETPTGTESAPRVGSRHAPSIVWSAPPNPGWTTRSFTTVLVPSDDAVTSRPQVAFGMPVGRSKIRSPELARRTCRSAVAALPGDEPGIRRGVDRCAAARPRVRRSGGESAGGLAGRAGRLAAAADRNEGDQQDREATERAGGR